MSDNAVNGYVKSLVSSVLCTQENDIADGEALANYGLTSIDLVEIIVKLEAEFKISFDPKKMQDVSCRTLVENIQTELEILAQCKDR